ELKARQEKTPDPNDPIQQLDFEFVLFDSALIDYDYIMKLIARFTGQPPRKQKMTREQLIGLLAGNAKFLDEREDMVEYINTLTEGKGLDEQAIREGYECFKAEKNARELAVIAEKHGLSPEALQGFIDSILSRRIFDPDALTELLRPLGLEGAGPKRAGNDGRPHPPAAQAGRGPGNFRAGSVCAVKATRKSHWCPDCAFLSFGRRGRGR
ncbi:type I restriction endonuclease subunit R, EcoR124 family, partial [Thiolapillus sp.]|uniref:type I restriction endonuclease subunit R, EcoR124 family n=1 Tax=Thiolapillus sp. TaxID=2017437 RepID=UPI003AF7D7AC